MISHNISQFKKSDWVTCLSGFNNGRSNDPKFGGRGYVDGLTFQIEIERRRYQSIYNYISAFFPKIGSGVYPHALRYATIDEINKSK